MALVLLGIESWAGNIASWSAVAMLVYAYYNRWKLDVRIGVILPQSKWQTGHEGQSQQRNQELATHAGAEVV